MPILKIKIKQFAKGDVQTKCPKCINLGEIKTTEVFTPSRGFEYLILFPGSGNGVGSFCGFENISHQLQGIFHYHS